MKQGPYFLLALLFCAQVHAETKRSENPDRLPTVQKIDALGEIKIFHVKVLPSVAPGDCEAIRFDDETESSFTLNLVKGDAELNAKEGHVDVCLHSDVAIFSGTKNTDEKKPVFHYLIEKQKSSEEIAEQNETASQDLVEPKGPSLFSFYLGGIEHHYKNQYSIDNRTLTWDGLQLRLMADGRIPIHVSDSTYVHYTFTLDTLNKNLSQQAEGALTLEKKLIETGSWQGSLGLGVSTLFFLGGLPYGVNESVSPLIEAEMNRNKSIGLHVSYSPFLGGSLQLSSAVLEVLATYPATLFHRRAHLGLGFESISISPTVAQQSLMFNSYGFSAVIGFDFGESK